MSNTGESVPFSLSGTLGHKFDFAIVPPEFKKEGPTWLAAFSEQVSQRQIDVNLVHTFDHKSAVCCVRFSADGKYLATGCNRFAQIYDTKTGAKTRILIDYVSGKAGTLFIRSVCFSPDGKYLATAPDDGQIRIWDIAKRHIRAVLEGHKHTVYSLDFSKDGRFLVSGSEDKTARIWDMETGKHRVLKTPGEDTEIACVALSPDDRLVAVGYLDAFVRIWDVQTGQVVECLGRHKDAVYGVAFTPDGKGLVSGSLDRTLKHWDLTPLMRRPPGKAWEIAKKEPGYEECPCTLDYTGHKDYVLSLAVSRDNQWVVSGSKDKCMLFWDLKTAQPKFIVQGHGNSVISVDISPTGGMLATGSADWGVKLWSYTVTP